ncbi:uncharacterized protein BDW43DRAFT_260234 [Aspergillus alliaceus]|uniref:uncharacterized protein n=1 Tax=Petromyces alliaceus TaxID=209559 RepID=UPI0012A3BC66|nr:uncharacterized protein BDW43DRAFT_260234 [Aspergillus alliaceus]KAB8238928.1 hypothetical protein BDW43DRAFT_260234 [Aspergillus alliaceus]
MRPIVDLGLLAIMTGVAYIFMTPASCAPVGHIFIPIASTPPILIFLFRHLPNLRNRSYRLPTVEGCFEKHPSSAYLSSEDICCAQR